ncbi:MULTISPECIES: PTS sugar transporter subunit IIB [unclassified Breznakia]|uniref:PTS system mannose/fructose/N-acetylgalactosamine-transporter subunit IIB n=1 Tax=unclassified Breznakia TaxID=2623764 RepID=UPI0024739CC9|nr:MULTISPECIES: PTS sugar transporter subunit IIB [unclassified Breznakia]MDH6365930.1 mannose/fructose/sorbose-specific phosphotransferase system IIB component [Breznakia sp. PH1-1]MDH6403138.1 mannose/fructose/sorbose-specific phosphotransferase system IIB component [Breznakia sp. PF1-11]MDH6410847.1 mannose/fructose/sorbose-specific phosphotransferase system IIB component [Breznakia sp. PFB1-11]MDH6413096.1 mannose/fructose/sorbose-specific phosphotransferase system IIB component [Breznakia
MITITRIDERLIHGQVAFAWTTAYKVDVVMVVDNEVSKDDFQKSLLEMACPAGLKCLVVDDEKAVKFLERNENKRFFIVVKEPGVLVKMMNNGVTFDSINVGGIYFKEGRRQLSKTVYVDDAMVEDFKKLDANGVALDVRTTPSDTSEDLMKLI